LPTVSDFIDEVLDLLGIWRQGRAGQAGHAADRGRGAGRWGQCDGRTRLHEYGAPPAGATAPVAWRRPRGSWSIRRHISWAL